MLWQYMNTLTIFFQIKNRNHVGSTCHHPIDPNGVLVGFFKKPTVSAKDRLSDAVEIVAGRRLRTAIMRFLRHDEAKTANHCEKDLLSPGWFRLYVKLPITQYGFECF